MNVIRSLIKGTSLAFAAIAVSCGGNYDTLTDYAQSDRAAELIPVHKTENPELWGYIDKNGKAVIAPKFHDVNYFQDGKARVTDSNELIGFIGTDGEWVIEPRFATATDFLDGIAWVALPDSALMAIDEKGNKLFDLKKANEVDVYIDGYAAFVDENGTAGIVDKKGQEIELPMECFAASVLGDGYVLLYVKDPKEYRLGKIKGGKVDLIAKDLPMDIASVILKYKLIVIEADGKYGLADFDGKIIMNPRYTMIQADSDDMLIVKTDKDKFGWINTKGEEVIKAKYKEVCDLFSTNGYASVSTTGKKFQIIDREGNTVCSTKYEKVFPVTNEDLFRVKNDEGWGLIKKDGTVVCEPQFKALICIGDGLLMASSEHGKFGVISDNGTYDGPIDYAEPERAYHFLAPEAQSRYFSLEKLGAEVGKLKSKVNYNTNFGEIAKEFNITKSNINHLGEIVALSNVKDNQTGIGLELGVILNGQPLVSQSYWSSKKALNSSAKPTWYYLKSYSDNRDKLDKLYNYLNKLYGCNGAERDSSAVNEFYLYFTPEGKTEINPMNENPY